MDTPPSPPANKLWLLPLLLTGVAASLLLAFALMIGPKLDQDPGANPETILVEEPARLSREDSLKLIELRNRSIGHLENHEFDAADTELTEIIRLLPGDPLGPRNLAICRQLALDVLNKNRDFAEFGQAAERAEQALQLSKAAEPKSSIPLVIAARVALKKEQPELALKELQEAIRLSPNSIGPAYDLFMLGQLIPPEQFGDAGFDALRKVFQKEPNNLFVIKDWLPLLAQRHDPEFAEQLQQVKATITPFVSTIKTNTRIDLNDLLQKASAAAGEGNWAVAQRLITSFRNLIVLEAARDRRFVVLDSLEYLLPEYGSDFQQRADLPAPTISAAHPVHFETLPDPAERLRVEGGRDVAVRDVDLDGQPDLIVLLDNQLVTWLQTPQENRWTEVSRLPIEDNYTGLVVQDFDDDVDQDLKNFPAETQPADALKHEAYLQGLSHAADPDVVLFGPAGLKLLENRKDGQTRQFVVPAKSAGDAFDAVKDVIAVTPVDLDNDGDLDLAVSTTSGLRIFSNRGNLTFEETTDRSILPPADLKISSLAIVDWDKDTDVDLLIATSSGAGWLENVRHGRLRFHPLDEFSAVQNATQLIAGDFDGNLSWDVLAVGPNGGKVVTTHSSPAGSVSIQKNVELTSQPVHTAAIGDFDNDGTTDIILLDESQGLLYRGEGDGRFSPVPPAAAGWLKATRQVVARDLDRDGDLDLITIDSMGVSCLSSQCRESDNPGHGWIEIQMVGTQVREGEQNHDKRTNHINLGGIVELKSGDRYQSKIVTEATSHFGLGSNQQADVARVLWTNGIPTNLVMPEPDQQIVIPQILLGSCPYLYTWNGERFEFVTDLLWNAPLGLKFAENVIAPWREWEYIKIDGRQLKPRKNAYELRVTAELWEADYFDQFKLYAIDHPAETGIYTNEKVGPPDLATPRIHTVSTPRKPVAARDSKGRDVLNQILERDKNYTKTFDQLLAQGLTEEHYLELDLGEFPSGDGADTSTVTMFLTGWMYPGCTSLSVQFSQNPDMPQPRPPALYVPDANGEWHEVRPFMGFPGGKTKTIAVDLTGLFLTNDHRLRIVSRMEIFWDEVFFTVNDHPIELRQTELTLVKAEVVDRGGVSQRSWPASGNGPDQFDYQQLIPGDAWPPMYGNFTRYGDVLPLLTARDDHLVVTGSGDEIQLTFAQPESEIPAGWVRDFVLYSVGWDKDADLNTVYGDVVEPLPFEAMTVYAHRNGEPRPIDEAYAQYLREYQTRQQNPTRFWKRIRER